MRSTTRDSASSASGDVEQGVAEMSGFENNRHKNRKNGAKLEKENLADRGSTEEHIPKARAIGSDRKLPVRQGACTKIAGRRAGGSASCSDQMGVVRRGRRGGAVDAEDGRR